LCRILEISSCACFVYASPSWWRSISGLGIGSMNGGWSRVVGMMGCLCVNCGVVSPTWWVYAVRARWSLCLVSVVVTWTFVDRRGAIYGRRRSQWSRGEFVDIMMVVWGVSKVG